MDLFTLDDQRDVIVIADAVLDGGRELTGAEIDELMAQLDRARLETLWREVHRQFPLGTWVFLVSGGRGSDRNGDRAVLGQVVGYRRARPGNPGHLLEVRLPRGEGRRVPVAEARVVPPPRESRP